MDRSKLVRSFCCGLLLAALPARAFSAITVTVDAELLKNSGGTPIPSGTGLAILSASTLNADFGDPTPTAFLIDDDIELARWSVGTGGFGVGTLQTVTELSYSGNWNPGDPFQLLWFPELSIADTAPGNGTSFGRYRHDDGLDGSNPWVSPADGTLTWKLKFFTDDASSGLASGGSNPSSAGVAGLTVVPEPRDGAIIAGGLCLVFALILRRRRRQTGS